MHDPTLDYQNVRQVPPLARRVAVYAKRIAWLFLAVSILSIGACFFLNIRELDEPYATVVRRLLETAPIFNMFGAFAGVVGSALGARWSLITAPLHLIVGVQWVTFWGRP